MILRRVDELPHGLINHAATLVGDEGHKLADYVSWLRERILAHRDSADYLPTLHIDTYGTIGETFATPGACARFLVKLAELADPCGLRIEQPIHARSRAE
jgi:methylaspartate ammonia-lyase